MAVNIGDGPDELEERANKILTDPTKYYEQVRQDTHDEVIQEMGWTARIIG
jgi:hypothetical protein